MHTDTARAGLQIRRATADDANGIVAVWEQIVRERIYSAIDVPFTVEQERTYLESLSPREVIYVATGDLQDIVAFQSLDLWARSIHSMRHVGQLGTFVLPGWRRCGAGGRLFQQTYAFARDAGYRKLVIQVRASNVPARRFYARLGFEECGRLTRQVCIDGQDDDEVLMELFL